MSMQSADGNESAVTRNPVVPGDDHLPELAVLMLRGVADRARVRGRQSDTPVEAIRSLCRAAHRCGLRAEQLLVVLKDSWRRLPEARRMDRYEADEVLARVIQECIEEYYVELPPLAGPPE